MKQGSEAASARNASGQADDDEDADDGEDKAAGMVLLARRHRGKGRRMASLGSNEPMVVSAHTAARYGIIPAKSR